MPLGALEEIDEVDAERLVCLPHLPLLDTAVPLSLFAEPSYLIRQGLGRGRARQESSHPAHEGGSRRRTHHLGLEQELAELLQ